jgi:DNA-binding transcriptional LysR family regulator
MKIEQLRYFLEAARQEHIGRAAVRISISPSAISRSISELERELGRELFSKRGKNVVLTNHGKLLMERAESFLSGLESIKDELASEQVAQQGHYRLAATHGLCARRLVPAWSRIQAKNPLLTAEVYTLRSADVAAGVASGEYDFGLCFSPQESPSLGSRVLYRGQLVIAVRRGHPLLKLPPAARAAKVSDYPASLAKAFSGVDNCESHPVFGRFDIAPKLEFMFDSYDVAVERLCSTDSWSLFPDILLDDAGGRLAAIVPPGWNAELRVTALWPKHRYVTRPLKNLLVELAADLNIK